ncbi:MAG TPA: enolase C-terminal domain-like protein [Acetobacteraceae bacterium]|nr:enolase C-terminal domain-like protein [Acetobacteraceae bacterium]
MKADPIARLCLSVVEVTAKTRWIFLEIETGAGLRGTGEATLPGREDAVLGAARELAPWMLGLADSVPWGRGAPVPGSLPEAAVVSALDHALWDVHAARQGRPVADVLGTRQRSLIPLYANINRRTRDRSPEGFAASALAAVAAGFDAIKIAPFDEVTPDAHRAGTVPAMLAPGLQRIAAVRAALGPGRDLLVDCHWRLDEAAAATVVGAAAAQDVYWVECPLPETEANLPALKRLRGLANVRGMRLAGREEGVGLADFAPFLAAGAYDVMMPDVKYVGGLAEMLHLAERFAAHGVAFSPHNPTGPVCHAASLHLAAVAAGFDRLEMQFDETPLFAALVGDALPQPHAGCSALPGMARGLGASLVEDVVTRHRVARFERRRSDIAASC